MVVISYPVLREFIEQHPLAKDPINNWYRLATQADWGNFHEIKEMFNSVDAVGNDRYVFNIKGNDFRIVTVILY